MDLVVGRVSIQVGRFSIACFIVSLKEKSDHNCSDVLAEWLIAGKAGCLKFLFALKAVVKESLELILIFFVC